MKMGMKLWMAAGVCLLVAGCTGTAEPAVPTVTVTSMVTPPSTTPPVADEKAVSWLDGLCGAVHGYRLANNQRAGGSTEVTRSSMSKMLGELADLAGKTVTELTALPASPVEGGDAAKQYFLDKYTSSRDIAAQGKQKLDAAKGGGAALDASLKAMTDAQNALNEAYDPLSQLKLTRDSDKLAIASAQKCRPTS